MARKKGHSAQNVISNSVKRKLKRWKQSGVYSETESPKQSTENRFQLTL